MLKAFLSFDEAFKALELANINANFILPELLQYLFLCAMKDSIQLEFSQPERAASIFQISALKSQLVVRFSFKRKYECWHSH